MFQETASVISNHEVMPGVHLVWAESPEIAAGVRPGQFVMISCDSGQERLLRRPISIYQVVNQSLAFIFAVAGPGTKWLASRQAGEQLDMLGPTGNHFSINPASRNLLLVAGGLGIAPLCFLGQEALKKGCQITLLYGTRTADQSFPEYLIPKGCDYIITTEDGTAGEAGFVTSLVPGYIEWADQVFICGPLPMYQTLVNDSRSNFLNKSVEVSLELRMGCGLGFCYACTIMTRQGLKQVCKDGPVFDMNQIIWDQLK